MLSGITQVWLCPADLISPPKELAGIDLPQPAEERDEEPQPREWMQGHMFVPAGSDAEHYSILAVPAHQPPHIHGCMISGTTTPAFYDVYISQYAEDTITVKYCVFNVERNGGAGDALALELDMPATGARGICDMRFAGAKVASEFRLVTTKLIAGDCAVAHLSRFAPSSLAVLREAGLRTSDTVVCLGAVNVS